MRKITKEELDKVLNLHKKWLNDDPDGVCADLSNYSLKGFNLKNVVMIESFLNESDLICTNFSNANLSCSDLGYSDLRMSDLSLSNLSGANLRGANLRGANLRGANLRGANLDYADLSGSDLSDVDMFGCSMVGVKIDNTKFDTNTSFFTLQCPEEGAFVGYKKADGKIVVLQITEDAKRSSGTTRKCRCSKAKVLRIEDLNGNILDVKSVKSNYDESFIYTVGGIVEVKDFNDDRWDIYAKGIYFFINKKDAIME